MNIDRAEFISWMERIMTSFDILSEKLKENENELNSIDREQLLDNQDVLQLIKISARSLQRYRSDGRLPYYTISGKLYYKLSDVHQLITGTFPTEMNNGVKAGIVADKQDIIEMYGSKAQEDFKSFGSLLGEKMHMNDPQSMADGILKIIQMKDGERPLRFPLDKVAEGNDLSYIDNTKGMKSDWASKYNVTIHH